MVRKPGRTKPAVDTEVQGSSGIRVGALTANDVTDKEAHGAVVTAIIKCKEAADADAQPASGTICAS